MLEQLRREKELLRKDEEEAESARQALESLRTGGGLESVRAPDAVGFGPSVFEDPGDAPRAAEFGLGRTVGGLSWVSVGGQL